MTSEADRLRYAHQFRFWKHCFWHSGITENQALRMAYGLTNYLSARASESGLR